MLHQSRVHKTLRNIAETRGLVSRNERCNSNVYQDDYYPSVLSSWMITDIALFLRQSHCFSGNRHVSRRSDKLAFSIKSSGTCGISLVYAVDVAAFIYIVYWHSAYNLSRIRRKACCDTIALFHKRIMSDIKPACTFSNQIITLLPQEIKCYIAGCFQKAIWGRALTPIARILETGGNCDGCIPTLRLYCCYTIPRIKKAINICRTGAALSCVYTVLLPILLSLRHKTRRSIRLYQEIFLIMLNWYKRYEIFYLFSSRYHSVVPTMYSFWVVFTMVSTASCQCDGIVAFIAHQWWIVVHSHSRNTRENTPPRFQERLNLFWVRSLE
jgi:hypothetical protein